MLNFIKKKRRINLLPIDHDEHASNKQVESMLFSCCYEVNDMERMFKGLSFLYDNRK